MIGLFPLLAIADRGDVGGISYTGHPQTGSPAIFLYDGVPGGAGLAEQGFRDLERLLGRTRDHVAACDCDEGCPACIQSPRCGNGNKPLDKEAALQVLGVLLGEVKIEERPEPPRPAPAPSRPAKRRHGITRAGNRPPTDGPAPAPASGRVLVFDLETQRSAEEVGGWSNASCMGLALAVVYDVERESYRTYYETDTDRLLLDLVMADQVIGFNIDRFDLKVLSGYTEWDLSRIRTLDLLGEVYRRLGFRLSLNHLAEVNLGESKAGDGLQSLQWWKEGRLDLVEQYCRKDVEVTHRLYDLGRRQEFLLYRDRDGRKVRVPVKW
jgi:DEAD/DEAH box helicase domain-containing protein